MKRRFKKAQGPKRTRAKMRHYAPLVIGVTIAGAAGLPNSSRASCVQQATDVSNAAVCLPRTGGAVIAAWAIGTLASATPPNSESACHLSHICDLVISSQGGSGTGTGATIKFLETNSSGEVTLENLPFTLNESIDYRHPLTKSTRSNSTGGSCFPTSGSLEITDISTSPSSHLSLDVVGEGCEISHSRVQLIVTGSYVTASSDGEFLGADGIGSLNVNNPTGLRGTGQNAKASLVGQLEYGD